MLLPTVVTPFVMVSCNNGKYTVTFYLNDGTASSTKQEIKKDEYVSRPADPTRDNYTFFGWFTEPTGGEKVIFPKQITSNTSFYAHWVSKEQTEEEYLRDLNIDKNVLTNNNHLIEATYTNYPFITNDEFISYINPISSACSTFYQNGFYGRNFDWSYGNTPQFVIHTLADASINRYATLGVALGYGFANPDQVGQTGKFTTHKLLPWQTVDGINEKGLVVSINEVPIDNETIKFNQGDNTSKTKLNEWQLIRYLLDYCSSVKDCEDKIKSYNIVGISGQNEQHIMVADATGECAEIEFVPISSSDLNHKTPKFYRKGEADSYFNNIVTNFTMINYKGDCNANWYDSSTSLGPRAEGCERYNILYDKLVTKQTQVKSLDDVLNVLAEVYYTGAYTNKLEDDSATFWFSDFNYSTSVKTTPHKVTNYQSLLNAWNFDKTTWDSKTVDRSSAHFYCTTNSSAYDIANKQLKLVFEEKYTSKIFKIDRSEQ